jgi:hypothetical protein
MICVMRLAQPDVLTAFRDRGRHGRGGEACVGSSGFIHAPERLRLGGASLATECWMAQP